MGYNSAAPDAFDEVVKVTNNHTELRYAELAR